MIKYEIYQTVYATESFHSFSSYYQYSEHQRIFVEKNSQVYSCTINSITGDDTQGEHVVRLTCLVKKYNPTEE